jgi:hypothetical protein
MEFSPHNKLTMYLAVKTVCDAKPLVWQSSEAFADAYADFCTCIANLIRLQPANGVFQAVAPGVGTEVAVADRILTTEMDELIEPFEAVDEAFVEDYTAARSMEFPEDQLELSPPLPAR